MKDALAFPAVELFIERVKAVIGDFSFSDSDKRFAVEICEAVNGVPLALEFAAARVPAFGLAGVARNLRWPLQFLTNCHRTAPPRQRSMSSSLDWSYALLSGSEQRIFRRLSVFSGQFTLREAAMIASDSINDQTETADIVTALASKSLLESDRSLVEPRFGFFTLTRAYALAKLVQCGEVDPLRRRHNFELEQGAPLLERAADSGCNGGYVFAPEL